jgi:hypothetical protein
MQINGGGRTKPPGKIPPEWYKEEGIGDVSYPIPIVLVVLRPFFGWPSETSTACFLHSFLFHLDPKPRTKDEDDRGVKDIQASSLFGADQACFAKFQA